MIHVAILLKPYIDLIISGDKSVECRLTKHARSPYEAIEVDDRVYFKQSAGPFRATAVVEHVLFEGGLTPARIRELKRDYNDLVRGDPEYWKHKRDARFATLIWLRDVEPIETGPGIAPSQGAAWVTLPEARDQSRRDGSRPRRTKGDAIDVGLSFAIPITGGNIRNGHLYLTRHLDRFPKTAVGGATRSEAGRAVTLIMRQGPSIDTDIVGPRKAFRSRHWRSWYEDLGAREGDEVVFTPIDRWTYYVGLKRA